MVINNLNPCRCCFFVSNCCFPPSIRGLAEIAVGRGDPIPLATQGGLLAENWDGRPGPRAGDDTNGQGPVAGGVVIMSAMSLGIQSLNHLADPPPSGLSDRFSQPQSIVPVCPLSLPSVSTPPTTHRTAFFFAKDPQKCEKYKKGETTKNLTKNEFSFDKCHRKNTRKKPERTCSLASLFNRPQKGDCIAHGRLAQLAAMIIVRFSQINHKIKCPSMDSACIPLGGTCHRSARTPLG